MKKTIYIFIINIIIFSLVFIYFNFFKSFELEFNDENIKTDISITSLENKFDIKNNYNKKTDNIKKNNVNLKNPFEFRNNRNNNLNDLDIELNYIVFDYLNRFKANAKVVVKGEELKIYEKDEINFLDKTLKVLKISNQRIYFDYNSQKIYLNMKGLNYIDNK